MSTESVSRRSVRYPGLWLSAAVVSAMILVLAWLGALEPEDPRRTLWVGNLGTQDAHVATVVDDGSDTLVVGHHDGLVTSIDGGRTWLAALAGLDVMALAAKEDHTLLVGGHGFIGEQETDGSFSAIRPGPPDEDIHSLTRSRDDPQRFWLVTGEGVLYRSVDSGASWSAVDDGPIVRVASGVGGPDDLWAIDAFRGLVSSTDGGETWSDGSQLPGTPVNALDVSPDGSVLLIATGMGGFLSQDDGASWDLILDEPVAAAAFEDNPDGTVIAFLVTPGADVYRYH